VASAGQGDSQGSRASRRALGDLVVVLGCPHTIAVVGRDDIFDALAAAFSTGKVEAARSLFSADYLDHQRPEGSDLTGPDEFTAVVAGARRSLGELAVRVASAVTWADDLCVAVLAWRGQDRGGAVVERETVETLRLDATGKIAEHWGSEIRCRHAADG
jgi:predicted SnoaL-like aldol condensation-catalyzing enzyme